MDAGTESLAQVRQAQRGVEVLAHLCKVQLRELLVLGQTCSVAFTMLGEQATDSLGEDESTS